MAPSKPLNSSLSRLRERAGVRVRALRNQQTDAEQLLWFHLRNRQLEGCKFRRQHRIGEFIVDFACIEAGVVVELDGSQHFDAQGLARDETRTAVLQRAGFTVLRFDNGQALTQALAVLEAIRQSLLSQHPHPSPLPQAGEGAIPTRSSR